MRRKWLILICVVTSIATAFFFTRNFKKAYKSTAQLSTRFTISDQPNGAVNYIQSEFKFGNLMENIMSPNVISLVAYHLLLHDLESSDPFVVLNPLQQAQASRVDRQAMILRLSTLLDSTSMLSPQLEGDRQIMDMLGLYGYNIDAITSGLKVERLDKTDYINIDYKSGNPVLSAFVVNTLCDEFRRYYNRTERQHTDATVANLDSLASKKKAILDLKQQAKEQYMANNKLVDVGLEGSSTLSQISAYESQKIEENSILRNES